MILHRSPLWTRPKFGRLGNGTSNAMVTTSMDFSSQYKLALGWWEFSSSSAGARCVMETNVSGFPGTGKGIGVWRNDAAPNTVEVAWTPNGGSTNTVRYFVAPPAGQWNLVLANIDTTANGANAVPSAWVNGVAQSLTTYLGNATAGTSLPNDYLNIGSRNAGTSNFNDAAFALIVWVAGYQWTQQDAISLYRGIRHPKQYLLQDGMIGFLWQPVKHGTPDVLFTKGVAAGRIDFQGMTLKEFPQRLPA
jgi:hypothetical protein